MIVTQTKEKTMLVKAIENSDILPSGQKRVLSIIANSDYPVTAKQIEKVMGFKKQTVNFTLKNLLSRNFVERKKDGIYVYSITENRAIELIERYKEGLLNKKKLTFYTKNI